MRHTTDNGCFCDITFQIFFLMENSVEYKNRSLVCHAYLQASIDFPLKKIQRLLYINRTSRLTFFLLDASLYGAGLSAPFSNPSCLGVFMQRAGSHSTGLVSLLLSTWTGASASCSCLFSFAVKASLIQTNTATDCRKQVSGESLLELVVMFLSHAGSKNVPCCQISKRQG